MLGRDDHVGHAEERVGARGEHGDVVGSVGLEGDLAARGAADPVLLLDLDALDEIEIVQIVDQTVGILGDAQHPLALFLADDGRAAALAHAFDDFLVGKTDLAAGAPVDGHGSLVGHAVLEQLQEDPLRPLVVLRIGRVHDAVPVEAVAEHFQLTGKVLDILLRDDGRVDVVLDRVVLGRQAEGVKADREEDVVALHPLLARDDVDRGEGARMAHMQTRGAGVRELDQAVELGLIAAGDGGVRLGDFPVVLPFLFNGRKIVFHD